MKTRVLILALLIARVACAVLPSNFNDPNIVIYGKALDTSTPSHIQAYTGALVFTITPTGGTAITVPGTLDRLDSGNYSYRLDVPVQKILTSAFKLDTNTVGATFSSVTLTLAASIDGAPATLFNANGSAHTGTLSFSETGRGSFQRIDLNYSGNGSGGDIDTDGDGMPDWWEIKYGLNPNDPSDAYADNDGDGVPNLLEYFDGTDPTCYEYSKWLAANGLSTAPLSMSAPDADPDGDGIPNLLEYAVGTDPRTADRALFDSKVAVACETISGKDYLTLTVHHPGTRQCNVDYIVETSADLTTWSSTQGTGVVTLSNTLGMFKLRDAAWVGQPGVGQHFIRMRIVQKP